MKKTNGYRQLSHTADIELKIWANDFRELLHQAALAINEICGIEYSTTERSRKEIVIQANDLESILVAFLSEITFMLETVQVAYIDMDGKMEGSRLEAYVTFSPIVKQEKEIKAITWHRLRIKKTKEGLSVNIVVDI